MDSENEETGEEQKYPARPKSNPPKRPTSHHPEIQKSQNISDQPQLDAASNSRNADVLPVLPIFPESVEMLTLPEALKMIKSCTGQLREFGKYLKFVKIKLHDLQHNKSPEYLTAVLYYKSEKQNYTTQVARFRTIKQLVIEKTHQSQNLTIRPISDINNEHLISPDDMKNEKHELKKEIKRLKQIIANLGPTEQTTYQDNLDFCYHRYQQLKNILSN